MMGSAITQLINLPISIGMALLVRSHYRGTTYPLEKKYHTFWPRFFTLWVDDVVLWPIAFLGAFDHALNSRPALLLASVLIQQTLVWGYSVCMHARFGQTVGKMACNIKIVDAKTEQPITFRQALMRDIVPIVGIVVFLAAGGWTVFGEHSNAKAAKSIVDNMPWSTLAWIDVGWFLLEVITMFSNDKRRALHDFIAGTVVIRTTASDRIRSPIPLQPDAAPIG